MRRALAHARRGVGRTAPNPAVGACVVTGDGVVVGDGCHRAGGRARTRRLSRSTRPARARAARRSTARSSPASTRGGRARAPSASSPRASRASSPPWRIPFPLVRGRGFAMLREHGIAVEIGVAREEAVRLNQPFLTTIRERRPFVILKAATSLDGRLAAAPGRAHAVDLGCGRAACALSACPGGRDSHRLRHAARRRSAPHRAPGLSGASADPGRLRPPVARVAGGPRLCRPSPRDR